MREAVFGFYPWIKAFHVVMIIAWIAGMMYLPRLFAYHHDAKKGGEAEARFIVMERRLLKGIINPAMVAVWVLGLLMLWANPDLLAAPWMHVKLAAALAISAVHGVYAGAQRRFARGERPRTARFWRILNEVPFVLVVVIVIMAIVEPF